MDWNKIVDECRKICTGYISKIGLPPTVRELFYTLVSTGLLPNTHGAYKTLSRVLSEKRYNGSFPFHYIRDTTRANVFLEKAEYYTIECGEEELKRRIRDLIENIASYSINPWIDQKYRIIAVVEKEAQFSFIREIISRVFPHGIYCLRFIRGYDSATGVKEIADMLKLIYDKGYTPILHLYGDFDPSGEDIVRDFVDRVSRLLGREVVWEKIAVTKSQIEEYDLPHKPEDEKEIEKLMRDKRFKKWIYGLYRVELEALFSLDKIDVASKIIKNAIEKYFDWKIYEEKTLKRMKEAEEKSREAKNRMLEKIKNLTWS